MTSEHKLCPVACPAQWKCQSHAETDDNKLHVVLKWYASLRDAVSLNVHHPTFWVAHFPKLDINFYFSWAKYTWEMTNSLVL